jgi:hypothetical protein
MDHGEAAVMLDEATLLGRRVRSSSRATWIPLTVFGIAALLSVPLYLFAPSASTGRLLFQDWPSGQALYWYLAGPIGYLIVALLYRRRERVVGVGGTRLAYLLTGIALWMVGYGLITSQTIRLPIDFPFPLMPFGYMVPGFAPLVAVAVGLLVLSWLDRSWPLALFAVGFGVLAGLAGLYIIDNLLHFSAAWQSAVDMAGLGLLLLGAAGVASAATHR